VAPAVKATHVPPPAPIVIHRFWSYPQAIHRLSTGYPQVLKLSTGYPQVIHRLSTGTRVYHKLQPDATRDYTRYSSHALDILKDLM